MNNRSTHSDGTVRPRVRRSPVVGRRTATLLAAIVLIVSFVAVAYERPNLASASSTGLSKIGYIAGEPN